MIRPDDPSTTQFIDLIASFGLLQHVTQPTHDKGGLLDVVLTRNDSTHPKVDVTDVGLSDHLLLTWTANLGRPDLIYHTTTRRRWREFNADDFRVTVSQSQLCDNQFISEQTSADDMLDSYNKVIGTILDSQAPFDTITCRKRPSDPWYDAECRAAKKSTRKLELRYKKTLSPIDRSLWTSSLKFQHKLAGKKKQEFWVNKINSSKNPRLLWQSIDEISGRSSTKAKLESTLSALDLSNFFRDKINLIRSATEHSPSPTFSPVLQGCSFRAFNELTEERVKTFIQAAPNKSCDLDPLPTNWLKECIDLFSPSLTKLFNLSLTNSTVPQKFKVAHITPIVKKSGLDPDQPENYRPISNLPFLSKVLECVVFSQIEHYLNTYNLLPRHQSAYRKYHSTETTGQGRLRLDLRSKQRQTHPICHAWSIRRLWHGWSQHTHPATLSDFWYNRHGSAMVYIISFWTFPVRSLCRKYIPIHTCRMRRPSRFCTRSPALPPIHFRYRIHSI